MGHCPGGAHQVLHNVCISTEGQHLPSPVFFYKALEPSAPRKEYPGPWSDGDFVLLQIPILIPCHRVIHSNGNVGPYSGGPGVKEWLLDHEGVLALPVPGNTGLSQPGGRCASEQKE